MNVTFPCPKCEQHDRTEVQPGDTAFSCHHCDQKINIPSGAIDGGEVRRCLACPSTDLFVRKDFPQRLGVALVAVGIIGSSIAWAYGAVIWTFAILFASALADVALYLIVPDALMCYRCGAMYRGAKNMDRHGAFDLETHERYRQQAARLAEKRV